jgi:hypothetical protein
MNIGHLESQVSTVTACRSRTRDGVSVSIHAKYAESSGRELLRQETIAGSHVEDLAIIGR